MAGDRMNAAAPRPRIVAAAVFAVCIFAVFIFTVFMPAFSGE
jgi:hypothetical protein